MSRDESEGRVCGQVSNEGMMKNMYHWDQQHNQSKNPECFRDVSKRIEQITDLDTKDADNLQRLTKDSLSNIRSSHRKSDS